MNWQIVNAGLNVASIIAWLWVFYRWLGRGDIVTRRENTTTLGLKDEIIATKDETIKELRLQNRELFEVGSLIREFIASLRTEKERRGGV